MMLPGRVQGEVEARFGAVRVAGAVGGGCIHPAVRLETADGPIFLKYGEPAPAGLFASEAGGLRALRAAADGLRVPEVLAVSDPGADGGAGWLALEWLEPSRAGDGEAERLGRGLARLHRIRTAGWGWEEDGFIGSLPQRNAPAAAWAAFWAERRIEPMLRRARGTGASIGSGAEWDRLLAALPALLVEAEADGPSLLHGDLWNGNVLHTDRGPALVDPAVYRGHREVDLAMSELFGGFGPAFYDSYREAWPLRPGYAEVRRGIYQLYYLLVHVILFGSGYAARTAGTLRGALAAA